MVSESFDMIENFSAIANLRQSIKILERLCVRLFVNLSDSNFFFIAENVGQCNNLEFGREFELP